MVNLTIRLNAKGSGAETPTPTKTAVEGPGTPKLVCGGHLIQAELPTASGLGLISDLAAASTPSSGYLGYKVRRTAGDKVHFCVRCHFPIAIYGRLDPCEHVFCLICAKKDINCYLCDERILRIQRLEVLEGIFVCGAGGCLRSFLSKHEFEWHIREVHSHLLSSRAAAPSKLQQVEASQPSHSLGQNQNAPTPSPPQSQPHSPSQSRQLEPPTFGSNSNFVLAEASPVPEKTVKQLSNSSGPSGDHSEPPSKRKKLELQLNAGAREREREKGRERDDHAKGHEDREREDGHRGREREHSQREREHSHRKRDRGNQERERDREKDRERDQEREFQNQFQADREQWEQQQHVHQQQQGPGPHYQFPPPPPPPPPPPLQPNAHQPERMVQVSLSQQGAAPSSFPPQGFPPFHIQQQQEIRNTPRFESPRHGPFMDPRMAVPPDYHETGARPRHPQQDGERARNIPPQQQEGFRPPMDSRQAIMVPHYHGDYGPMGMPMGPPAMQGMVRFPDGAHGGGHLPPPKRGNFGPSGENALGHPPHGFGWGGPANFAGAPGHPPFMNWQNPQ